jgi:putative alpha-1,2-mannosidase
VRSGQLALGSPLFNRFTLRKSSGAVVSVIAHNNSAANVYVAKVLLNGEALPAGQWFVPTAAVMPPAVSVTLEFFMAATPPAY